MPTVYVVFGKFHVFFLECLYVFFEKFSYVFSYVFFSENYYMSFF